MTDSGVVKLQAAAHCTTRSTRSARESRRGTPIGLCCRAVSLVLNYITAYQMLHHSAHVRPGQRALIHGAAGGVGSALLQLGRLASLELYGTCSARGASAV